MSLPWYKQFWPWFLMAFPLSAVIAGFTTLFIFLGQQPVMVVDDYYKKGKAINFQKDKQNAALVMKLEATLDFGQAQTLFVKFPSGSENLDGSALTIHFYHTTLAHKDFSVMAIRDGRDQYIANLEQHMVGKWQVSIEPHDAKWRLRKTLTFPLTRSVELTPFSY